MYNHATGLVEHEVFAAVVHRQGVCRMLKPTVITFGSKHLKMKSETRVVRTVQLNRFHGQFPRISPCYINGVFLLDIFVFFCVSKRLSCTTLTVFTERNLSSFHFKNIVQTFLRKLETNFF